MHRKVENLNVESITVLPKIFEAILNVCTDDFKPLDIIVIELECDGLDENIYLHVAHFEDFNVGKLFRHTEFIDSSKKFKIDEYFKIVHRPGFRLCPSGPVYSRSAQIRFDYAARQKFH